MKIRTKITLAFLLTMVLSLSALFLFIYLGMSRLLYLNLDRSLHSFASTIERDLTEEHLEGEGGFYFLPGEFSTYWLKIVDEKGRILSLSPLAERLDIPVEPARVRASKAFNVEIAAEQARIAGLAQEGEPAFRVLVKRVDRKSFRGWIMLAFPIGKIEQSLENLLVVGLAGIITVSFLTALFIFLFTRKVLAPLEDMARKASQIGKDDLSSEVFDEGRRDEIGTLARTLNSMLQRLRKAFESQQRFISDASHELKTPISILRARWEKELNNPALPLVFRKRLAKDVEILSRMASMIEDLLILSRTERKEKSLKKEELSLSQVLQQLVEEMRPLAEAKGQELVLHKGEDTVLLADRNLLYRLFLNIVKNAIEYTPEGGRIEISSGRKGNYAFVRVTDTGIGIPEEDLPRIFERFYRVERSRSKEFGGSGLGLAIAKWIAEAHNGWIDVKSKLGSGSSFTVYLPLQPS